ncbi:crocetin glucosyltransferase, chloroplastic-like [Tripterygium wilfordii]|uniref:crocetin glucosyltransferase, chloroplastic-like n=1 Tax=Tripterygium wilfordii TaxID=458696 RepID=UPI0018F82D93|nr:crocetin glucosyltransferase, chloroplastic-like [Tripterygium wilfordii]
MSEQPHILLVSFPAQGHINPTLQLADRLFRIGLQVTFATSFSAHKHISKTQNTPPGLSILCFSDGYDQGFTLGHGSGNFMSQFKLHGMKNLKHLILDINSQGARRPITHIIYCHLVYWASIVARELHIPSTMLWNQAATVLGIYYHNFHGYEDFIRENVNKASFSVTFPGLHPLSIRDLPSFFHPSNEHVFVLPLLKQQFEILDDKETSTKVLVNTFDALESETLKALNEYPAIGVGPLIPSSFLDGRDLSDNSKEYMKWLSSKASNSVIYVSFGSLSVLAKPQMEEIARALIDTGHPFLWVIRETDKEKELSCRGELEKQGMIVPWCSQVEVLSHPSIGCFMSHCGWNSTFESLTCGIPMVGFPQWADQATNVKLVQDVWKTGVRVAERNDGLVEADDIKRCLDLVMGSNERGEEMRLNANKWKELAREATMEGGSSDKNLRTFVDEVLRG